MQHPEWPLYLRLLLGIHILCGAAAFVCAPVALATAKGGRAHRAWGRVYFWAMAGVAVTALIMSLLLPILFLALVAVFSFYASFQGYRVLRQKEMARAGGGDCVQWYDWFAAIVTLVASFALAVLGVMHSRLLGGMSLVSVVFGIIGMRLAWRAISLFRNPPQEKMFWWFEHMQGMIGSYIAACTAFSSVNLGHWFGNAWWVWLWPTMVGVPAIFWWTSKDKKRFAPRAKAA